MLHNTHSLGDDFKECLKQFNILICTYGICLDSSSLLLSQSIERVWSDISRRSKDGPQQEKCSVKKPFLAILNYLNAYMDKLRCEAASSGQIQVHQVHVPHAPWLLVYSIQTPQVHSPQHLSLTSG